MKVEINVKVFGSKIDSEILNLQAVRTFYVMQYNVSDSVPFA